jgi:4-aminobutyrate aminotransferase-like enzyme
VELAEPGDGRSAAQLAVDVRERARRDGLIVELGDPQNAEIHVQPPLNVRAEVIDSAVTVLSDALKGALREPASTALASRAAAHSSVGA